MTSELLFMDFWNPQNFQGLLQGDVLRMLPLLLLLLSVVLVLLYQKSSRLYRMTRHIPGPPRLPLLGNGLDFLGDTTKIIPRLLSRLDEYDDFLPMWFGPKNLMVAISHPDDLQVYYTSTKMLDRPIHYKCLAYVLGPGSIFVANGVVWKKNRRPMEPAFHPNVLKTFPSIFYKHSNIFLEVIRKEVGQGEFDVIPYMKRLTFDLIFESSLDIEISDSTEGSQAVVDAERIMDILGERLYKPWLAPDIIFNQTSMGRECRMRVKRVWEIFGRIIAENQKRFHSTLQQREEKLRRNKFIYHMIEAGFQPAEIIDQIMTIVTTSFDATSAMLSLVLMMLGMHQEIQDKLYQEVVKVEEALAGREADMEDLGRYTYMERVFKETMRLFPIGPVIARACTEDIKFRKYTLPKGAGVAAVMFKTHRDPRWFPDPLRFDPDRFLPENIEGRHPYCYVPFSAGPRNCIGEKYAMMSMKIVLSRILLKYKVHCRFTVPEIRVRSEVTIRVDGGFLISLENRIGA